MLEPFVRNKFYEVDFRRKSQQILGYGNYDKNVIIETSVVVKDTQSLVISSPKKYKRDAILGDLRKAHGTSSNFELENQCIKKKYLSINFA